MILVINAIRDLRESRRFDEVVLPGLLAPRDFVAHRLSSPGPLPRRLASYSRLLISGSELSAAERNPRDEELEELIRAFAGTGKPVLGICYGFQMLARALTSRPVCRRAAVPEFGWKELRIRARSPLFAGLDHIVPLHSHYDEVFDLGPDFTVLASTAECEIQAAQYRDLPVWGVQFHPELGYREGERMLERNLESEPLARELAGRDLESAEQADANLSIVNHFLCARAIEAVA
ncbi:MAG: hypothetical protein GY719_04385 [bacterium]|nr:hypothetical protein [bacterium]